MQSTLRMIYKMGDV